MDRKRIGKLRAGFQRLTLVVLLLAVLVAACRPATPDPGSIQITDTPPFTQAPTETDTAEPAPTDTTQPVPTDTAVPPTEPASTPTQKPVATVAPTATRKPPAQTVRLRSPEYGMQCFLWYKPEVASRDVQLVRQAGFGWIKQGVGWRDVEISKGVYNWVQLDDIAKWIGEQQLNIILRLDHQPQWAGGGFPTNGPPANYEDFGNFCYALASRYRGRFRAYEIWNEPNLSREWGGRPPNPAEYVRLLKVAYRRIKQA
ncbi:MAG: cellulase family glycosylhydrolase, partial [Anaerolineae bacterium]|nr:cellulase family glycosylhydrolase [Anaerolineae bacterium]